MKRAIRQEAWRRYREPLPEIIAQDDALTEDELRAEGEAFDREIGEEQS